MSTSGANAVAAVSPALGGESVPEVPQQAQLADQSAIPQHHPEVRVPHVELAPSVLT